MDKPEPTELGLRVRQLREMTDLLRADLGPLIGASSAFGRALEEGSIDSPRLQRVVAIADLFSTSLDWLARGRGAPPAARLAQAAVDKARARRKRATKQAAARP